MPDRSRADAQSVDVYWLPYCTTCQKAVAYLHEQRVPVRSFRDLEQEPLEEAEVRDLARKAAASTSCSPSAR